MKLSLNNFLYGLRQIVVGGGRYDDGSPKNDSGFVRDVFLPLSAIEPGSNVALAADETNARVLEVTLANDVVGYLTFPVPRDYDEATDVLKVAVLASQKTVSTDDDVELDSETYVKTAGSALGSDVSPAAPGTVLSTTEQWVEFDLSGNNLVRDQVVNHKVLTNGGNDTSGEEVLIHAVKVSYRSTLVSYDEGNDAAGHPLR